MYSNEEIDNSESFFLIHSNITTFLSITFTIQCTMCPLQLAHSYKLCCLFTIEGMKTETKEENKNCELEATSTPEAVADSNRVILVYKFYYLVFHQLYVSAPFKFKDLDLKYWKITFCCTNTCISYMLQDVFLK